MAASIPVLITGGMPEETLGRIRTPGFDFYHTENPSAQDLARAEIIIGQPPVALLAQANQLKWLQIPSSGADSYAHHPDFPRHVLLTNATGAFGRPMAEYVLAAVFTLMRRFHLYRDNQHSAVWLRMGDEMTPTGKHVLILGTGDIGSHAAELFRKFDCRITGVRRTPGVCPAPFDAMVSLDEAQAYLPQADIIVCALPNTPLTRGYLNRDRLRLLKPEAILVNVGRGTLVDHDALAELLSAGKIYGAALDVTDPEPLPADHPLWRCPGALITPHVSGQTFLGLEGKADFFYDLCRENLERYRRGEILRNIVDLDAGYRLKQD